MKKTPYIQLVLITAVLAGCSRPLYQQDTPDYYYQDPMGDEPDSTNSCPLGQYDVPPDYYTWDAGFRPYGASSNGGAPFGVFNYYSYRFSATIIRAGFGHGIHYGHAVHA